MKVFLFFIVLVLSTCYAVDPDLTRNVSEIIKARGYPEEDHHAITPDGFILSLQRITGGRNAQSSANTSKPVVFLQHGLDDNSASWVILDPPTQSLGFILADLGYDVWLGNSRGNYYSTAHVSLTPKDAKFWAWSFDEMAEYDLPTNINYILNVTGQKQLTYIGHSQGTIQAFAGFEKPEVAAKVNLFIALAPVAWVHNSRSTLLRVLASLDAVDIFVLFGVHDFTPDTPKLQKLLPELCKVAPEICDSFLGLLCGFDTKNLNNTRLPVIVAHEPSGTSVQNMAHWSQLVDKEAFQKFDYGIKNHQHYNQSTPPQYNPSLITTPTALFWGDDDVLADPVDVKNLLKTLKNVVYTNEQRTYAHLDFVWGESAKDIIYPDIARLVKKYATNNKA